MKILTALFFAAWAFAISAWCVNLYKLTGCDFASPYKCEVAHGVGLIPVAAPFTVWFGTDAHE